MCNCELDECYVPEPETGSNSPKSAYGFGQAIVKDGEIYLLKGIGGNGVHSFTKKTGSGMCFVREGDIAALIPAEDNIPSVVSLVSHRDAFSQEYLEVSIERDVPLHFEIKGVFKLDLIAVFNANPTLLTQDMTVSLFESESIMDKIPEAWLYDPKRDANANTLANMSGEEITALFVTYFKEGTCPDWLEPDSYFDDLSFEQKEQSDLDILDRISWLDFETVEEPTVRITIDRIVFLGSMGSTPDVYLQDRGIDYKKIVAAVREKYGLEYIPNRGYDFVLQKCAERYLLDSCEGKMTLEEIKAMVNASADANSFKSRYKKFLTENGIPLSLTHGYGGGGGECYQAGGTAGFSGGSFDIAPRGLLFAYNGEFEDFNEFVGERYKYEDKELWNACYSSLSGGLF